MSDLNIADLLTQFSDYLQTEEAKKHLGLFVKEKAETQELIIKLSGMEEGSPEFIDLVLYGLLPYSKTKLAKRVSTFPVYLNIKPFFSQYKYTDDDWKIIAKKLFNLCFGFYSHPENLEELITEFTSDRYSKSFQTGAISPIFFALNDAYPVVNHVIISTYRNINLKFGKKDKITNRLLDYPEAIKKLSEFRKFFNSDLLATNDNLDLFCYWYDNNITSKEVETENTDDEIVEEETRISPEPVDYNSLIRITKTDEFLNYSPHSLADPVRIKIRDILNNVDSKKWMLPDFQRYFDWEKVNISELWEAILRDYFVGSFLLWRIDGNPEVGIQPITGVKRNETDEYSPEIIILDGQQRMTALYYAVNTPHIDHSKQIIKHTPKINPHTYMPIYFYINFNTFYSNTNDNPVIETHSVKITKETQLEKLLFPIFELENHYQWTNELEDYLRKTTGDEEFARSMRRNIDRRLQHIWDGFEIPYVELPKSITLKQVTDIFEGINTKGKPLNVFDLLIARLRINGIELRMLWNNTLREFPKIKEYFGVTNKMPVYLLQAISLLYEKNSSAKRADILNIYSNIYKDSDRDFESDWKEISEYTDRAIAKLENLRDGFGVKSVKELPFAPMIPVLTALLVVIDEFENKPECNEKLSQWYWSAIFTSAYSSAADSQMTMDFRDMRKYFETNSETPRVIAQMHRGFSSLYFKDIHSRSNVQYRGVMSLLALEGVCDFNTSQNLENARQNDKDHLFPRSLNNEFGNKYIDSVLNMTWMSDETNRHIKSAKRPSKYILQFISEKYNSDEQKFISLLRTHFIDEKAYSFMREDNFDEFLNAREAIIIEKIKKLVNYDEGKLQHTLIQQSMPFSNSMAFLEVLNDCDSSIYWLDKYFSEKGLQLLASSLTNNRVQEVKILGRIPQRYKTGNEK